MYKEATDESTEQNESLNSFTVVKERQKRGRGRGRGKGKSVECSHCEKTGHTAEKCWELHPELRPKSMRDKEGKSQNDFNMSASIQTFTVLPKNTWVADSGAGRHFSNNKALFITLRHHREAYTPYGAPNVWTEGIGDVILPCKQPNGSVIRVKIENVLYVPSAPVSLLSTMTMKRSYHDGLTNTLRIKPKKRGSPSKTWGYCDLVGGTPIIRTASMQPIALAANSRENRSSRAPMSTWHRRLGHISFDRVEQTVHALEGAEITENDIEFCETCQLANSTTRPSRVPQERAKEPFDLVYTDLLEYRRILGINRVRYALVFTNDFSRYC